LVTKIDRDPLWSTKLTKTKNSIIALFNSIDECISFVEILLEIISLEFGRGLYNSNEDIFK
jgi:hypothetical protein